MLEKYGVLRDLYHGLDYSTALNGTPHERLTIMAADVEWVRDVQLKFAAKETTDDDKKKAHRHYQDDLLNLS